MKWFQMAFRKTYDLKAEKTSLELLAAFTELEADLMSDREIRGGTSYSSSTCCCSNNEAESYYQCKNKNETPKTGRENLGKYWNLSEQQDSNIEDIITAEFDLHLATSDSEDSSRESSCDDGRTDSVTEVTDNTSPSHLTIPTPDYDKPCLSSYFTPEKYTRTKVRTFRKSGDQIFKIEASSAINRRKKQFEIDRQNMIILKKLREVKPVVVLPK